MSLHLLRPLLLVHGLWAAGLLHAQDQPFRGPVPRQVDATANKLLLPGDTNAFARWHAKLDELLFHGTGQVQVVHFGGSHVQADMWSGQLRHRLQTMVPGVRGGRGFLFPYNVAKSNNPYWYDPQFTGTWTSAKNVQRQDTASLGISGYAITTRDSLATLRITFRGTQYPGYRSDHLRVYHRMDSSTTVVPMPRDGSVQCTVTTLPDAGYTLIQYDRPMDTLDLRFVRMDPTQRRFTLYGLDLGTKDPGISLSACGVNGASTSSWVRCDRFERELRSIGPDLVVLSIGINDAHDTEFDAKAFERNYVELIGRIRRASPGAAILLTTNNDSYIKRRINNRNATAVRASMLKLAREHDLGVWDLYSVMGGAGSMRHWQSAGLAKADRIHFTREGYTVLGDLLFTALMQHYADHLTAARKR